MTCSQCDTPISARNKSGMCFTHYRADYYQKNKERLSAKYRDYYAENREDITANRKVDPRRARSDMRKKAREHGLDPDVVEQHFLAHNGLCDICGRPPQQGKKRLSIDHDHLTGAFRGLLCQPCNTAIGMLQDDVKVLESAIAYLQAQGVIDG